jgi:hypothetical protein
MSCTKAARKTRTCSGASSIANISTVSQKKCGLSSPV